MYGVLCRSHQSDTDRVPQGVQTTKCPAHIIQVINHHSYVVIYIRMYILAVTVELEPKIASLELAVSVVCQLSSVVQVRLASITGYHISVMITTLKHIMVIVIR